MEELTTEEIARRVGVTKRTVQRWIASGQLAAESLRGSRYAVNEVDLVELARPDHATKTFRPRTGQPSYEELYDKYIHLQFEVEDLDERVRFLETRLDQVLRARSGQRPLRPDARNGIAASNYHGAIRPGAPLQKHTAFLTAPCSRR